MLRILISKAAANHKVPGPTADTCLIPSASAGISPNIEEGAGSTVHEVAL